MDANGAAMVVTEAEFEYDFEQQPGERDREYLDPEWTPEDLVDALDAAKRQAQRMSGHGMAVTGNQDGPFVTEIGDGW
ncbi:MAG: hypothetical protein AB8I08_03875 [Sandaracinaceae bacterium]